MAETLRVITLNCWGLKYLSKARNERLTQIGTELANANPQPEIVGLQECWTQQDYKAIREKTQHILPYGKFYYSGIFGGGLAILSKWPIEESSMVPYKLNGRPTAFFRGDWFVGKGVACAKIRIGDGRAAEVFCTHLHAPYEKEPKDSYLCHRTAQAWEIAKLMHAAYEKGNIVLGLGDFNMIPLSLAHKIITAHGRSHDVWRLLHPNSSIGACEDAVERKRGKPIPTAEFNLKENGTTCDSVLNTWRWNKGQQQRLRRGEDIHVDPSTKDPRGKRLDYIFLGDAKGEWMVQSVNVGMVRRHPTIKCSLSDHFSVEATLVRGTHPNTDGIDGRLSPSEKGNVILADPQYLSVNTYDEVQAITNKYIARERLQRRLRLGHFWIQFAVSIGCFIAVWWSPHNYVSFILMLLSTIGLSAGVLDGLIAFLFVSSELRALKEFQWEIDNAREAAKRLVG